MLISRRHTLRLLGGSALLLAGSTGCGHRSGNAGALRRFEVEKPQMGVPFRVVLYAPDEVSADQTAAAVWDRIAALNSVMSDYEADSELSRLSRTAGSGQWVPLSDDLARVLRRGQDLSGRTDGAFDVTVGPVVMLWRRARRQRALPAPDLLAAARAATGWRHLQLRRGAGRRWEAQLLQPGMRLDLGGIAKGDALDAAGAVLRGLGVNRFLVSGGGDLLVGDPPPGEPGWTVEVGVFDTPGAPPSRKVQLVNRALATSGDVFQHVEINGVRYSHIVDPRTGIGLTDHSLVTVIARHALDADAWSTAVSVLGPREGLSRLSQANAEALILRQPGTVLESIESPGFRRYVRPTEAE